MRGIDAIYPHLFLLCLDELSVCLLSYFFIFVDSLLCLFAARLAEC